MAVLLFNGLYFASLVSTQGYSRSQFYCILAQINKKSHLTASIVFSQSQLGSKGVLGNWYVRQDVTFVKIINRYISSPNMITVKH